MILFDAYLFTLSVFTVCHFFFFYQKQKQEDPNVVRKSSVFFNLSIVVQTHQAATEKAPSPAVHVSVLMVDGQTGELPL